MIPTWQKSLRSNVIDTLFQQPPFCLFYLHSLSSSDSPLLVFLPYSKLRFSVMASANLKPLSLPPKPTTYDIWQKGRPQYLSAYKRAFDAEVYATQQAGPTKKKNIMFARVAGFILVELFNRQGILTEGPCEHLSKELLSDDREGGTPNDVVFKIGDFYCNHFIRVCASHFFRTLFGISISLQFGQPPLRTPHPPCILLALPST